METTSLPIFSSCHSLYFLKLHCQVKNKKNPNLEMPFSYFSNKAVDPAELMQSWWVSNCPNTTEQLLFTDCGLTAPQRVSVRSPALIAQPRNWDKQKLEGRERSLWAGKVCRIDTCPLPFEPSLRSPGLCWGLLGISPMKSNFSVQALTTPFISCVCISAESRETIQANFKAVLFSW